MFEYFNYNVLPNQQYQVMIGLINKNQIVELELLKVGELELWLCEWQLNFDLNLEFYFETIK